MKWVELHIARRQAEFAEHQFFAENRAFDDVQNVLAFAPDLTFWVMAFQDILRLNTSLTRDPEIRKIVRHHRAEDAGHERWFLEDLETIKLSVPGVRDLFGSKHSPTRDAAYALVAEVFRVTDDRLRLVLVKTLESAGHVFFGRVAAIVERAGWTSALKYFSFSHLEVEKNHEVFEREISQIVSSIRLPRAARAEAKQLVDRCYAAFNAMFEALCTVDAQRIAATAPAVPRTRARSRTPQVLVVPQTAPRQARARG